MKDEPLALLVGQNVQHYRKAAGMTQAQLAESINVSTAFISRLERGEKGLSVKVLAALAKEFRISCDALLQKPEARVGMENIQVLLAGRSEAYIAWVEKILRACGDGPEE